MQITIEVPDGAGDKMRAALDRAAQDARSHATTSPVPGDRYAWHDVAHELDTAAKRLQPAAALS